VNVIDFFRGGRGIIKGTKKRMCGTMKEISLEDLSAMVKGLVGEKKISLNYVMAGTEEMTAQEYGIGLNEQRFMCCFCGEPIFGMGSNPEPMYANGYTDEDELGTCRCCKWCYINIVIPYRRKFKNYRIRIRGKTDIKTNLEAVQSFLLERFVNKAPKDDKRNIFRNNMFPFFAREVGVEMLAEAIEFKSGTDAFLEYMKKWPPIKYRDTEMLFAV